MPEEETIIEREIRLRREFNKTTADARLSAGLADESPIPRHARTAGDRLHVSRPGGGNTYIVSVDGIERMRIDSRVTPRFEIGDNWVRAVDPRKEVGVVAFENWDDTEETDE